MFESVIICSRSSLFQFKQDESTHMTPDTTYVAHGSACVQQSGGGALAQQSKNNISAKDSCDKHVTRRLCNLTAEPIHNVWQTPSDSNLPHKHRTHSQTKTECKTEQIRQTQHKMRNPSGQNSRERKTRHLVRLIHKQRFDYKQSNAQACMKV